MASRVRGHVPSLTLILQTLWIRDNPSGLCLYSAFINQLGPEGYSAVQIIILIPAMYNKTTT